MNRQRLAIAAALLVAWGGFVLWQYQRFCYESRLIGETTHQSAHSVMSALLGGIQSHRRLGRYFELQLEGMVDELIRSEDVLAAAIVSDDGEQHLTAGRTDLLPPGEPVGAGDYWDAGGFRLIEAFHVEETAEPMGFGGGRGPGGGRGLGRRQQMGEAESELGLGGDFFAVLLLDRTRHDQLVRRAGWSSVFISLAGGALLISLAVVWRGSVRLVEARGRARLLQVESQHWRELSQAAAGLAHETRNPLGLIRGWTQRLAAGGADSDEQQHHARAVIEECDRVTARINQFLAFARPCEPELGLVDVCSLVDELRVILHPDLDSKDLSAVCQTETAVTGVLADRELLRQALFNLVQNASQFAPEGDSITIHIVDSAAGCVRIEVADRGPGVPPESEASLFTPYFTTRADGAGLGLAIVRRIALAHGWQAGYRSRPGGGAIFFLDDVHDSKQADDPGGR